MRFPRLPEIEGFTCWLRFAVAVPQGLRSGDDNLRQACAEARARNEAASHPLRKEANAHDDLPVRRAAVVGLAATTRAWAIGLLEKLQHTEQLLLVSTAAHDVHTRLREPGSQAHRPHQRPESRGLLIASAAQHGMGVPPGPAALEVLRRALREGDELTRRAAAEVIARRGEPAGTPDLVPLRQGHGPEVAEAAFQSLANIAAALGTRLAATAGT